MRHTFIHYAVGLKETCVAVPVRMACLSLRFGIHAPDVIFVRCGLFPVGMTPDQMGQHRGLARRLQQCLVLGERMVDVQQPALEMPLVSLVYMAFGACVRLYDLHVHLGGT